MGFSAGRRQVYLGHPIYLSSVEEQEFCLVFCSVFAVLKNRNLTCFLLCFPFVVEQKFDLTSASFRPRQRTEIRSVFCSISASSKNRNSFCTLLYFSLLMIEFRFATYILCKIRRNTYLRGCDDI